MNRRSFVQRIIGGIATAIAAPFLPRMAPTAQRLMFHPDAFALTMNDLGTVTRVDVLYGWAAFTPQLACRVLCDDVALRLDRAQYRLPASRLPA